MASSRAEAERVWNLPNSLTFFRIGLIPPLILFLFFPGREGSLAAALTFAMAALTDLLDGYIARRRGTVTTTGRLLDPMADKLLVTIPMVMLIPMGRIPALMVALMIAREIAITALRGLAAEEGLTFKTSPLARYKTAFQSASLIALLLHYEYLSIDFHAVGLFLFWIAFVLTIWSGLDYFFKFYIQHRR